MFYSKKQTWLLLAIVIYLLVNIPGIFIPMVVNAAKYAQVGREILDNHDWINLTIGHEAYDQKPPLLFWIAATIYQIFGLHPEIYKLTILLISLIGVYGTFKLGELLYNRQTGILAALFWASSLGYVHFHNDIHTDTLLVVPVILSIWQYALFFKNYKNKHFLLGTIFVGLAMLTKGPVGMVIPASAVGLHLLLNQKFKDIFSIRWLLAIPIIGIIILPALWGLFSQFGLEGIKFYFWTNNMGRITGTYHGSNSDPFFYIHTSLYMVAPWTVFCCLGLFLQTREKLLRKFKFTQQDEFYTLGGIFFYVIIASIAKAKNPHYEMAILPLIMILGARWTVEIFNQIKSVKTVKITNYINLIVSIILWAVVFLLSIYIFPESRIWFWLIIAALLGAFIYSTTLKNRLHKQVSYLFITISAFLFTLNVNVLQKMQHYQAPREACRIFNEQAKDDESIHLFTESGRLWEIFLYSDHYGRYIVTAEDYKQNPPKSGDWLFTGEDGKTQLSEMNIPIAIKRTMKHRSLSRMTAQFLNPKTRASKLSTLYLIQVE